AMVACSGVRHWKFRAKTMPMSTRVSSTKAISDSQVRALTLLARSPRGCPESLLVHGHGISIETLVELINAGLAKVRVERVSRPAMEVAHVEITDAGRAAVRSADLCHQS